jgi:hypothetical protein
MLGTAIAHPGGAAATGGPVNCNVVELRIQYYYTQLSSSHRPNRWQFAQVVGHQVLVPLTAGQAHCVLLCKSHLCCLPPPS